MRLDPPEGARDLPLLRVASGAELETWLTEHHAESPGVWLVLRKKDSAAAAPTYEEALDVALCFGWIDGQTRRLDDGTYQLRYTPRRPRSRWAQTNVRRVEALERAGRMRPAGLAQVAAARADGRWAAAYGGAADAVVPPDLQQALDGAPAAAAYFASLSPGRRFAIIDQVGDAKRPLTRARRIARYVEMLGEGRALT